MVPRLGKHGSERASLGWSVVGQETADLVVLGDQVRRVALGGALGGLGNGAQIDQVFGTGIGMRIHSNLHLKHETS